MKNILTLCAILILLIISYFAQESFSVRTENISPEIRNDNTVTFRLMAPQANDVKITGDWIQVPASLTKDGKGLWSYTSPAV
jgi:enterochelin esterase family protein